MTTMLTQIGSIEGYTSICEYSIYCHRPNFSFDPNPSNSRGEWGAGADTTRYGLDAEKQDGGIIYTEDGRALVAFRSNDPKRIKFRYALKSFEEPNEDLRDCICYYKTQNHIYFLMKLPHKGKYTLEMYAKYWERNRKKKRGSQRQKDSKKKGKDKDKKKEKEKNQKNSKDTKGNSRKREQYSDDDDEDSYESICNYLIKSDVGCYDLAPYPPLNNVFGQTGDVSELNEDDELCLKSDTDKMAVIDPYESGEMTIVMNANREPSEELRAEMVRYYQRDGEEEDCSEYVMLQREDNSLQYTIDLLFPKVGFYKLSLTSGDRLVHQYLINVIEPNTSSDPYPTRGSGWHSHYRLRGATTGYLEADRRYMIQAKVGDAARKMRGEFDDGQVVEFEKNGDEWEGEIHTDPRGGGQFRVFMEEAASGKEVHLLTYKVRLSFWLLTESVCTFLLSY